MKNLFIAALFIGLLISLYFNYSHRNWLNPSSKNVVNLEKDTLQAKFNFKSTDTINPKIESLNLQVYVCNNEKKPLTQCLGYCCINGEIIIHEEPFVAALKKYLVGIKISK